MAIEFASVIKPIKLLIMKTAFAFLLLFVTLVGCSQKPDPKIIALQKRVDALSDIVKQDHIDATNALWLAINNTKDESELITKVENYYRATTNIETRVQSFEGGINPATGLPTDLNYGRITLLETKFANLVSTINGKRPVSASPKTSNSSNVPDDVMAQIRADAEKQFPNDYDEQVYIINQQIEAWQKLNP